MNPVQRLLSLFLAAVVTTLIVGSQVGLAAHYDGQASALARAAQTAPVAAQAASAARRG